MRKALLILIIGLLITSVLTTSLLLFLMRRFGDVRPAFLPPAQDISKIIEKKQNLEHVSFPLKLFQDLKIGVFGKNLGKARDLELSPGGTLLVSSHNQGKVFALLDRDKDGRSEETREVLTNLNKPHGLAFYESSLFVAELTQVVKYHWNEDQLEAKQEKVLFSLPFNGGHDTRSMVFDKKGRMFVTIGSSCNICEEKHPWLTTVIVSDKDGTDPKVFARGLRNSVFLAVNPKTGELWGTEMGRDLLGDEIPPDEINIIREGKDYGWPYCYGNKIKDLNFSLPNQKDPPCQSTEAPIYEIAAHSAPLGFTFIESKNFPGDWQGDLLVAYHGSWNRSTPIGYSVVRLKVKENSLGEEEDFLSGFLKDSSALGRPVDLTFDKEGDLYISDDKAGLIYKITR